MKIFAPRSALILGFLLIVGCVPVIKETGSGVDPVAPEAAVTPQPNRETATPPPTGDQELSRGEVPQVLIDAVLADLLQRTGEERSAINVVSAQAVTWSDGSLGCPKPGVMYTQALVDGFQIIFDVAGERYDYHLSDNGNFVLCE